MAGVEDDALLSPELLAPLLDEGLELLDEELGEAELPEDELSLGVLLPELMPPLGDDVDAPELVLPAPEGAPASDPAEGLALVLAPDAPEELLDAPPAPCAQAAVEKATMVAVTAALMSFRFIFSSSRVGMEMDCAARERKNNAVVRCAGEPNSCAKLSLGNPIWTRSGRSGCAV